MPNELLSKSTAMSTALNLSLFSPFVKHVQLTGIICDLPLSSLPKHGNFILQAPINMFQGNNCRSRTRKHLCLCNGAWGRVINTFWSNRNFYWLHFPQTFHDLLSTNPDLNSFYTSQNCWLPTKLRMSTKPTTTASFMYELCSLSTDQLQNFHKLINHRRKSKNK